MGLIFRTSFSNSRGSTNFYISSSSTRISHPVPRLQLSQQLHQISKKIQISPRRCSASLCVSPLPNSPTFLSGYLLVLFLQLLHSVPMSAPPAGQIPSTIESISNLPPSLPPQFSAPLSPSSYNPAFKIDNAQERKKVLIIFTGGTIGMSRSETGYLRPQKGFVHTVLSTFTEINHPDMPSFDVLEWENPMDSSDFAPNDWIRLALQISDNYYNYDGFVILSGTDTMAYTSSMLSFLLENLSKTVVLTGAMIPLNEPMSDAKRNLVVSMMVAAHLNVTEVLVFFNTLLLRGNRAKKIDPWRIGAFESPSSEPLATMGVGIHVNTKMLLPPPSRRFSCHTRLFTNIICLTITPSFSYSSLRAIATGWRDPANYANHIVQSASTSNPSPSSPSSPPPSSSLSTTPPKPEPPAVVLLLFGSGNAPIKHPEWKPTLDLLISEGCPVVVISQCLRGSTSLDTYEGGTYMKSLGVIDGVDLTLEACTTKLAYLMGRGLRGQQLKLAMETDLRGELSKKNSISYAGSDLFPPELQARL